MKSVLTIDELFEIEGSLAIIEKMERRAKQRNEEAIKDKVLHESAKRRLAGLRAKEKKEWNILKCNIIVISVKNFGQFSTNKIFYHTY